MDGILSGSAGSVSFSRRTPIYTLPTLRTNAKATDEDVAEIFVRVNSGDQKLTEKNFIETLLAAYDNDVHDKIDKFCTESRIPKDGTSYNFILKVDPSHLIRMAVAVGFCRARLRYAYMLMRGKNLETGIVTKEEMDMNFTKFKKALDEVTYFYTGSTESEVEKQFADLRNVHTADEFVSYLDYNTNIDISDAPPAEYVDRYRQNLCE